MDVANPLLAVGLCCGITLGYKHFVDEQKRLEAELMVAAEKEKRLQAEWAAAAIHGLAHNLKNRIGNISMKCDPILSDSISDSVRKSIL